MSSLIIPSLTLMTLSNKNTILTKSYNPRFDYKTVFGGWENAKRN
jgi:hypothetical protein